MANEIGALLVNGEALSMDGNDDETNDEEEVNDGIYEIHNTD